MPRSIPTTGSGDRALRPVALATAVAGYLLVVLGSTVRVTDSGMGCVSWPLCNGRVGPIDRLHPLLEQLHRYLAAGVSVGVLVVLLLAWRARGRRRALAPALAATALLAVQVVLGAVTVLARNAPFTVALHLVGGLLLLAALVLTAVGAAATPGAGGSAAPRLGLRARLRCDVLGCSAVGATLLLLASGSVVVANDAGGACPSWPWCSAAPGAGTAQVAFQFTHRALAALTVAAVGAFALRAVRQRASRPRVARRLGWALLGLLPAQVAAGAVSALLSAPAAAADVHLALAAAIWGCAVALVGVDRPAAGPDVTALRLSSAGVAAG